MPVTAGNPLFVGSVSGPLKKPLQVDVTVGGVVPAMTGVEHGAEDVHTAPRSTGDPFES